ncbi:NAD(P)/FAD-dependent oxidoreductase [Chloroflexus sp.]|uniref:NAD(P)/FAD-dependent oxidoreductase n=1 Tax=Chloroflexus sp. TaxID=1904827 RepID=UPI002ACE6ED7|nr:NAD(P)/FAD-dependent oxidoreductase [Chloroflexus sp.]
MASPQSLQSLTQPARPRVVIAGAGFGGLAAVRALAKAPVEVLLINRTNYHGFWPLLYQVATAGLEPESIAYPVRAILRRYRNASFLLAEVSGVDFARRLVQTNAGPVSYDYLILAAGSTTNFFGNEQIARYTMGMKDLNEAQRLRNHVLLCCEHAAAESDPVRRAVLLTFAVVGGGPTGVELAGAFVELIRHVIRHDYPMLDVQQARVVLIEATSHILASFPASLQRAALQRLQQMGVEVRLNTPVAGADPYGLSFRDGSRLDAETVVWAAGVRGAPLADAQINDLPMQPFRYVDKGQMATIGRSAAVLDAFGIRLSGWPAWAGWLFVHLMALVGFRNQALVLLNWAYSYFTYDRGVRLIFGVGAVLHD